MQKRFAVHYQPHKLSETLTFLQRRLSTAVQSSRILLYNAIVNIPKKRSQNRVPVIGLRASSPTIQRVVQPACLVRTIWSWRADILRSQQKSEKSPDTFSWFTASINGYLHERTRLKLSARAPDILVSRTSLVSLQNTSYPTTACADLWLCHQSGLLSF